MGIREDLVAEARSWIGTPWEHQGRIKGRGADCVCIVTQTPRPVLGTSYDLIDYERTPEGIELLKLCRQNLDEIHPPTAYQLADVVVMHFNGVPHHLGIIGDYKWGGFSLIHADNTANPARVVEHRLDTLLWRPRIIAAFRYPGVPA